MVSLTVTLIILLGTLHEILEVIGTIFYRIGLFLLSRNQVQDFA
jgi:hypothetical protein